MRSAEPTVKLQSTPRRASLFVTSEMADFIKAGGLGDVAAALPRALHCSCDIRVLIPGYPAVLRKTGPLEIVGRVAAHAALPACALGRIKQPDGLCVYVLLCPALFERQGSPYVCSQDRDWDDNALHFATLSYAAAQIAGDRAGLDWTPDLLHLNDWPCALAAAYVRWSGGHTPCLLTIHNLAYQGLFPYAKAASLGIPNEGLHDMEFYGQMSFLRAGIVHAHHVNTVSVSYAAQITSPAQGCGLDALLAQHAASSRLSGIVNGIDASWDPRHGHAPANPFRHRPVSGQARERHAGTPRIRPARQRRPTVRGGIAAGPPKGPGSDLRGRAADRLPLAGRS